jgi:hypothetical protein
MTYRDSFIWIKARIQALQRIPVGACAQAERDEEEALITALETMQTWSGSFPPEAMLLEKKIPLRREAPCG